MAKVLRLDGKEEVIPLSRGNSEGNMKIGYARVSTLEQNLDMQIRDLEKYGCDKIFTEKISGVKSDRPVLQECLNRLQEGDTLVVWRLDRLGRSLKDLVTIVSELKQRNIKFKSLQDGVVDTTTASGELIFNIFAALSQFERDLIRERTLAGLSSARARGRTGGRPSMNLDDPKIITAQKLHADRTIPIDDICKTLHISKPTLYRYLHLAKRK